MTSTEYHHAPVTGVVGKKIDGEWAHAGDGWAAHHALMEEFLKLRSSGEIVLKQTVNYGHPHFHGHSGRVDVYAIRGESKLP